MLDHRNHRCFSGGAVEFGLGLGGELHNAVLFCEQGVIAALHDIRADEVLGAALAKDDLADGNALAVIDFDAKPLRDGVAT